MTDRGTGRVDSYTTVLVSEGVPQNLAEQVAEILDKEITGWEANKTFQRTDEEQHIINSAHAWMFANGGNHETK